jgi:AIPR protein
MISDHAIDQAYSDLQAVCGGSRNDYFGLLYLEQVHGVPREKAKNQVAFGGNDYGLDGFHFDAERRNLYLFQFKYSDAYSQFKGSLQRLIGAGMERIFVSTNKDDSKNQILLQLRSCMIENRAIIDQVCFHFVFTGDPADAERSQTLNKLREDLENKKHLLDQSFSGQQVTLVVEFRSAAGRVGGTVDKRTTHTYDTSFSDLVAVPGPAGELMHIGLIGITDLQRIYSDMGRRFFERNIRYGLGEGEAVNRAISRALKEIVLDKSAAPELFSFNHNGITMFAEKFERIDGIFKLTEPRLLNGAQTVTTLDGFLLKFKDDPKFEDGKQALASIKVLCKIITNATQEFVTSVTINNNRQNPIEPWNLRANDLVQLELEDKFRSDLGIYYERQEKSFERLNFGDLEEAGITEMKAIQMVKLAQTFLMADGSIDRVTRMRQVFEEDRFYDQVFNNDRLGVDSRYIILCYKVQWRLTKLTRDVEQQAINKYWFMSRARHLLWALLCQAILNDRRLNEYAESYGTNMTMAADYTEYLVRHATGPCRLLLSDLVKHPDYATRLQASEPSFLRTNRAFERCMEFAYKRYRWVHRKLR